ncbi:hypothetical protein OSTOST_12918, partial [Ostertagia ostertagi]
GYEQAWYQQLLFLSHTPRSPRREKDRKKSEKSRDKEKRKTDEAEKKKEKDIVEIVVMKDKTEAGTELERLMEERRRKVEIWRARRNKAANAAENAEKDDKGECSNSNGEGKTEKKMWSLEDDEDDDLEEAMETSDVKAEPAVENGTEQVAERKEVSPNQSLAVGQVSLEA